MVLFPGLVFCFDIFNDVLRLTINKFSIYPFLPQFIITCPKKISARSIDPNQSGLRADTFVSNLSFLFYKYKYMLLTIKYN